MYKDKDKQREANRQAKARQRAKQGMTLEGMTSQGMTEPCLRPGYVCPIPEDQRKPDINYGPYMTALELEAVGLKANRVSVPGDKDYEGVCSSTVGHVGAL